MLSFHLRLGLARDLFPSGCPTETVFALLISLMRATCPANFIFIDLITLVKSDRWFETREAHVLVLRECSYWSKTKTVFSLYEMKLSWIYTGGFLKRTFFECRSRIIGTRDSSSYSSSCFAFLPQCNFDLLLSLSKFELSRIFKRFVTCFLLRFCSVFWWLDMNIYLVLCLFTSRPAFLLAFNSFCLSPLSSSMALQPRSGLGLPYGFRDG
jgi:hypothetical protein